MEKENRQEDQWIDQLAGREQANLSEDDKQQAELLRSVVLSSNTHESVDQARLADLKKRLEESARFMPSSHKSSSGKILSYALAASVICGIGLNSWYMLNNGTHDINQHQLRNGPSSSSDESKSNQSEIAVYSENTKTTSDLLIKAVKNEGGSAVIIEQGEGYLKLYVTLPSQLSSNLKKRLDEFNLQLNANYSGVLVVKEHGN